MSNLIEIVDDQVLTVELTESIIATSGATTFLGLTDSPNSYAGEALKGVRVNAGQTALEFATIASGSLSDGDYGDIVVSSGGTVLTYDGVVPVNKGGTGQTTEAEALGEMIQALTADGSPDLANDYLVTYDASADTGKKVLLSAVGVSTPVAVASGGTGQTTEAEALGEMTQALTEDTTPDRANDFLMTYDASADTGKKAKVETVADVVKDTTPQLGGLLDSNSHAVKVPAETGDDHRDPGLDSASKGGSAFNFRTPAGAKVLELRSGAYFLSAPPNYDSDENSSYFFISNAPAHGEVLIGVDQDQANLHHTRLGIKTHAGDPMNIHFDLDGPQPDYPSLAILSNTDDATATNFAAYISLKPCRTTGGSASLGTFGTVVSLHANDYLGGVIGEGLNSGLVETIEYSKVSFTCLSPTDNAEIGLLTLSASDGTNSGARSQFGVSNGITIGQVVPATLVQPGKGNIAFTNTTGVTFFDSNLNEIIKFPSTVASAINEFTISNAASGTSPSIAATGGGTDLDVVLTPKGTGHVKEGTHRVATLDEENLPLTGGVTVTEKDLGTVSSGTTTLDMGDRPMHKYTNNGAHTLAPGAVIGSTLIAITNGASAGAITTSGWTKVAGDSFTTTNAHKFLCAASVSAVGSLLTVQAMQ